MYSKPADDPSLFPDEGYGIVFMDMMKAPDDDDFINLISSYATADEVDIPEGGPDGEYYVHSADGDTWTAEQWREEN